MRRESIAAALWKGSSPLTLQRRVILEAFLGRQDHPTTDALFEAICTTHPEISRTTVYRNLESFVAKGLAVRVAHPGGALRYDPVLDRHDHFLCVGCGAILDLPVTNRAEPRPPVGLKSELSVLDSTVYFRGYCGKCGPIKGATTKKRRKP